MVRTNLFMEYNTHNRRSSRKYTTTSAFTNLNQIITLAKGLFTAVTHVQKAIVVLV